MLIAELCSTEARQRDNFASEGILEAFNALHRVIADHAWS